MKEDLYDKSKLYNETGVEKQINEFTTIRTPKNYFFIPKNIVAIGDMFYGNYEWFFVDEHSLRLIEKYDYFCRENDKERKLKLTKELEDLENRAKEIRKKLNEL